MEPGLACGKDHLGQGAIGVEAQHEAAGGGGRSGVEETFELRKLPSGGLDWFLLSVAVDPALLTSLGTWDPNK